MGCICSNQSDPLKPVNMKTVELNKKDQSPEIYTEKRQKHNMKDAAASGNFDETSSKISLDLRGSSNKNENLPFNNPTTNPGATKEIPKTESSRPSNKNETQSKKPEMLLDKNVFKQNEANVIQINPDDSNVIAEDSRGKTEDSKVKADDSKVKDEELKGKVDELAGKSEFTSKNSVKEINRTSEGNLIRDYNEKQREAAKTPKNRQNSIVKNAGETSAKQELPLTILIIQKGNYIYEKLKIKYSVQGESKIEVFDKLREEIISSVQPRLAPENILFFNKNKLVLDSLGGMKDSQEQLQIVVDLVSSSKEFTGAKELKFNPEILKKLGEPSKFRPYITDSYKDSPLCKYYQIRGEYEQCIEGLLKEVESTELGSKNFKQAYELETKMNNLYEDFLDEAIEGVSEWLNSQGNPNIVFLEGMYSSKSCKFLHKNTVIIKMRDNIEESYKKIKSTVTCSRILDRLGFFNKALIPFSALFRVSADELFLAFSVLPTTAKRICYGYMLDKTIINNDFSCDKELNLSPAEISNLKGLVQYLQRSFRCGMTGVVESSTKKKKRVSLLPSVQIFKTEQGFNSLPAFSLLNSQDLAIKLTKTNFPTPVVVRPELYVVQDKAMNIKETEYEIFDKGASIISREDKEDEHVDQTVEEFDEERRILLEFYKNQNEENDMLSSINSNKSVTGFVAEKEDWQTKTNYKKNLQEYLEGKVLNEIAAEFEKDGKINRIMKLGETIKLYLHERGVNLRYLGQILKKIKVKNPNHPAIPIIQCEIIARTIKNIVIHCIINMKEQDKYIEPLSKDKVTEILDLVNSSTDDENVIKRESFWEKCHQSFSYDEEVEPFSEEFRNAVEKRAQDLVMNKLYLKKKKKILILKKSLNIRLTRNYLIRTFIKLDSKGDRESVKNSIEWAYENYDKIFVEKLIQPLFLE